MRRHSAQLTHDSAVLPWLGANFWSRTGGPLMWRNYDPKTVREELAVLRDHGLNMTRSFFYWPDFHPEPGRIDEELCERFRDFLDAHTEAGMGTIPTFIVGHMSGENWDPAWRGDRDLYEDVWLVGRQAWFVSQMTRRFKDHPAVTGWLITNEMPGYGRIYQVDPPSSDVVTAWAQFMCDAVRAAGGTQPVSLGDGAWGIEVTGRDNGFSLRDTAEYVDFVGPHVYRSDTDRPRQHYRAAFECELAAVTGQPVVLEEFGLSTDVVSAANAGVFYRQTLHNSLLGGATGWIAWNNTDYDDLWEQSPYDHHPFEMHFGITDHTEQAEGTTAGTGRLRRGPEAGRLRPLPPYGRRRRTGRTRVPGARLPLQQARGPPADLHLPAPGIRGRTRRGPAGGVRPGGRRAARRCRAVPAALDPAADHPHPTGAGAAGA